MEKTIIIYFIRKMYKTDLKPFIIKGQIVQPQTHTKILRVVIDTKLKYKQYIAEVVSKGFETTI